MICICTPKELNIILQLERSRGRITVKCEVPLIGYKIGTDGKPMWYGYHSCETCGIDALKSHKTIKLVRQCRSCANSDRNRKWTIAQPSIYQRWKRMLQRCTDPYNPKYHRYGGRGITVCKEWNDFMVFQEWCLTVIDYPEDGRDNYVEIHRADNDAGYNPDNCVLLNTQDHANEHKRIRRCKS